MSKIVRYKRSSWLQVVAGLWLVTLTAYAGEPIAAITRPSAEVALGFPRAGQIAEVLVREGDRVQVNQKIARQDDREEQTNLAINEAKAHNDASVESQKAVVELRKFILERYKNNGVGSRLEIDYAQLELTTAELNLKLAILEHAQDARKLTLAEAIVDKMQLRSPINGVVEKILLHPGEMVDSRETRVISIVSIDPLWVDVAVPTAVATKLTLNQPAQIQAADQPALTGAVLHIGSVADAGSNTLLVRLAVPNPNNIPAGLRVQVSFPAVPAPAATPATQPAGATTPPQ